MKIKAGQVVKVKDIGQLARVVETVGRNAVLDFYFPEGILREKVPKIGLRDGRGGGMNY